MIPPDATSLSKLRNGPQREEESTGSNASFSDHRLCTPRPLGPSMLSTSSLCQIQHSKEPGACPLNAVHRPPAHSSVPAPEGNKGGHARLLFPRGSQRPRRVRTYGHVRAGIWHHVYSATWDTCCYRHLGSEPVWGDLSRSLCLSKTKPQSVVL